LSQKIRLLIVDDHKMVREGLRAFLAPTPGFEVVGEASNGVEAIEQTLRLKPDLVLLDLMMPGKDGIQATLEIKQQLPDTKILIITSFVEESKVIAAIKAGASGYLLKDSSPLEIETAIQNIYQGESAFPSRIASILVKELNRPEKAPEKVSPLTEREIEILKLIAHGMSNQEIADQLFLSVWTIRTYVTAILDKLQVDNRTQATLYAIREGLVKLDK
jgi:NarL family two-component system response regulator LiaR